LNKLEALDLASVFVGNQTSRSNQLCIPFLEKYGTQLKTLYVGWDFFSALDMSVHLLKTFLPNVCCLETTDNYNHVQALEKLAQAGCNSS